MSEVTVPYRFVQTSVGEAIVVHHMAALDEFPDLLAAGLAVWLEDELPLLAKLTPPQRILAAARRRTALDEERAAREADPARTAYGAGA